jgi:acyl carrier protein
MDKKSEVMDAFCAVVNGLKRTGLRPEQLKTELFLGGDLGIDSVEMLEVWYDLEQRLGIRIEDSEKRNINTVDDALAVAERKLVDRAA